MTGKSPKDYREQKPPLSPLLVKVLLSETTKYFCNFFHYNLLFLFIFIWSLIIFFVSLPTDNKMRRKSRCVAAKLTNYNMKSLRELFRIGKGPSSSHTMGPDNAARIYASVILKPRASK